MASDDKPQMTEAELEAWALAEMEKAAAEEAAKKPASHGQHDEHSAPAINEPVPAVVADPGDNLMLKLLIVFGFLAIGLASSSSIKLSKPKSPTLENHGESPAKEKTNHDDDSSHDSPSEGAEKSAGGGKDGHGESQPTAQADAHASEGHGKAGSTDSQAKKAGDSHSTGDDHGHGDAKSRTAGKPSFAESDTLFRSGNFREALKEYRKIASPMKTDRAANYRVALAQEAVGRYSEALRTYDKAIDPDADPYMWSLATLGKIRASVGLGDTKNVANWLAQVELRSGHPQCRNRNISEECLYQRARIAIDSLGVRTTVDPLNSQALAWSKWDHHMDHYLDWLSLTPAEKVERTSPSIDDNDWQVTLHPKLPSLHRITLDRPRVHLNQFLHELAVAVKMKLAFAEGLEKQLAIKEITVDVDQMPMAQLLAAISHNNGIICFLKPDTIVVEPAAEAKLAINNVRDMVQVAMESATRHPNAEAMNLAYPNLYLADGRTKEAVGIYRRQLMEWNNKEEALQIAYNLGLASMNAGETTTGRSFFKQVVDRDRTPKSGWTELGWWWIARSYLDEGDTASAMKPLRTALLGNDKTVSSAATLGLVLAHLLNDNAEEARGVLIRNRTIPKESHLILNRLVEAWFRYHTTPTPIRAQQLLSEIANANEAKSLGPSAAYVVGKIYSSLGKGDLMVELYANTLDKVRGPLAIKMNLASADYYWNQKLYSAARPYYRAVAGLDPDGAGPVSRFRLAEIALKEGKPAECIANCQWLLNRKDVKKSDVLRLMGRGYEKQGEMRLALECYAGHNPADMQ